MSSTLGETSSNEPRTFGGRFRTIRLLKQDRGVETWLARDQLRGGDVVVKAVQAADVPRGVRQRLEHEAQVLRQMEGSYLAPLLDFGITGGSLHLCFPYVPGVTLEQRLREGPLSVADTLTVGRCLLEALQAAHDRAVLHRDVKPTNVIVEAAGPIRQITLIDFGLARGAPLDTSIRDLPADTVRYLAPEQAGFLERGVDARSDLYSVGAVLFECLAGRAPFLGEQAGEVLRQHLAAPVPELRGLGIAVPRALDALVGRLLRKDPRDRYQSARAALADLTALAAGLQQGFADPVLVVGACDRRPTLTEPAFVGRVADLESLEKSLTWARRGRGGLVLVEAPSGGGKSWLLNELAQRALAGGFWLLRGRGVDRSARRPFQLLGGVAEEVVASVRSNPDLTADLRGRLNGQREAAAAVLPELGEILGVRVAESLGPEAFGEARSLPALADLLDALGSAVRPAVVLLDDCQWADELTPKLLRHWSQRSGSRHVLVVAAFRSEEVPADHLLRGLQPTAHLVLPPFTAEDVADLVQSMAGPVPTEAIEVVARFAEGNPFMAAAVLRGLVESGALAAEEDGWRVRPLALADLRSSRHAAALLTRRLELLTETGRRLLSVGAVLGKDFDLDLAAQLAGQTSAEVFAVLEEARQRQIVWADSHGSRWVFVHDKLREALLDRLSTEQRRQLHGQAAERLEKLDPARVFELAYHFDAAGVGDRALPYALAAAHRARVQQSLAVAEGQYRIAERGAGAADPATRRRIAEGLGEVLMLRGDYDNAARQFETARALADTDIVRAQLEGQLGELAFKRGDVRTARQALERGLQLLGRPVPRSTPGFWLALLGELVVQALHTVLPRLFLARRQAPPPPAEREALRLYSRLAYAYWFSSGKVPCLWAHLREMNLAECYPPTAELAQAYSEHGPVMTMLPWFRRGIAYVEKSLAIRRALGDLWGQGQSLHFYGVALYGDSRFEECIEKCQEAIRLLERTGDRWEVNTARWHIAFCLYRLGDLKEAVRVARQTYEAGREIGDRQARAISLSVWAKAAGGKVPEELIQVEWRQLPDDVHTRAEIHQAEAARLLAIGKPRQAADTLEEAQRLIAAVGLRQEYVAPILSWLATALRQELEQLPSWATRQRRARLRHARRVARRALRLARSYRNNLPHALREAAWLAAMSGQNTSARRLLDESLRVAERQKARHEQAQTLLARGQIGSCLGWPDAAAEIAAARRTLLELRPEAEPSADHDEGAFHLSLADRFETLLDVGRRITSALSPDAVYAAVREAALNLLRAERCTIVEVNGETDPVELKPRTEQDRPYSGTLARQCLAAGRPVAFAEGLPDDPRESPALAEVRSALGAPILIRGQPRACFGLLHRQIGGLFGETEKRLAAFIAALAGAALENAEGFAQLQNSEAELRRANEAKDQFTAMLAHELRNPLAPLLNALHVLRGPNLAANTLQEIREMMERQVRHLTRLVDDLLDVSRITRGKVQLRKEEIDLARAMARAVETHRHAFDARRQQLTVSFPAEPLRLEADPVRLAQVLGNLLNNAAKYSEEGGHIWLTGEREENQAVLQVRDEGVGIAPDMLPRVFDLFAQAERSLDRSQGGLGIGLTLVKSLVELHGGTVAVRSDGLGKGSTFLVRLPLRGAPPVSDSPKIFGSASHRPPSTGQQILVVDDNVDAAQSLALLLRMEGNEVRVVHDGLAALEIAEIFRPEVVLLDIGLPGLNGYQVACRLRQARFREKLLLVAITGYGAMEDRQRSREAGFDHHLVKPVKPEELHQILRAGT